MGTEPSAIPEYLQNKKASQFPERLLKEYGSYLLSRLRLRRDAVPSAKRVHFSGESPPREFELEIYLH